MYLLYMYIYINIFRWKTDCGKICIRMSCLALSFRVLAGNASSGFKVLCQENNSFITVLLVSSPRFVTSVEDKMKFWMSDKQQTGSMQKGDFLKMGQNRGRLGDVSGWSGSVSASLCLFCCA